MEKGCWKATDLAAEGSNACLVTFQKSIKLKRNSEEKQFSLENISKDIVRVEKMTINERLHIG
jgi:hypothetical protein